MAITIMWERFMKYADGLDKLSGVKYHPHKIVQWCKVNAAKEHQRKINGTKPRNDGVKRFTHTRYFRRFKVSASHISSHRLTAQGLLT